MHSLETVATDHLIFVAQVALLVLLVGGTIAAFTLSARVTDPPTAGKLVMDIPPAQLTIPPNQQVQQALAVSTPIHPPYTIILTGQFNRVSDPDAQWGIQLCNEAAQTDCDKAGVLLLLTSDSYFNLYPFAPDTSRFTHLQPDAQPNEIYVNVDPTGHTIIRLNHEIAWEGQFPTSTNPTTLSLVGKGGKSASSSVRLLQGSLYAAP